MNPAPAQVSFTSNAFLSPEFLGGVAILVALAAGKAGIHVFDDQSTQQLLVMFLGVVFTGVGHWLFPGASGKLGLTAPAPWSTPASQDIPAGTSVVAVPAPRDAQQTTAVQPLYVGAHRVEVAAPTPVIPSVLPPTVTITPAA